MSKFDEAIEKYKAEFIKIGVKRPDKDLLHKAAKACGPSLYNADACKVSSSDKAELDRVKKNFIAKKLGVKDEAKADKAIAKVVAKLGPKNRNKYRAMFYYLLCKELKKSL